MTADQASATVKQSRRRRLRLALTLAALLALAAPTASAPTAGWHALVVGISRYDPALHVPDLAPCEEAAEQLAERLRAAPGLNAEVAVQLHQVPRQQLLSALQSAADQAGAVLFVAIACAGDADGLLASDGRLSLAEVLKPLRQHKSRRLILALDAGGAGAADVELGAAPAALVTSADTAQQAWPLLIPESSGVVHFMSAAAAGWSRAFEHEGAAFKGDLGNKGALSAEDLQLAAEGLCRAAVPDTNGRRLLQKSAAEGVLRGVSGPLLTLLESKGQPVSFDDIRKEWGHEHFELFADVLYTLSDDSFRRLDAATQQAVIHSIGQASGSAALHRVHDNLLHRGLLKLPHGDEDHWKELAVQSNGDISIILPASQHVGLRGARRLAVSGGADDNTSYYLSYGRYDGHWSDEPRMVLELQLQGTAVSGTCDGDYKGAWLRTAVVGRYDAVARRVEASALGKIDTAGSHVTARGQHVPGADHDQPVRIMLSGEVSADGSHIDGTWKGSPPTFSESGHWQVTK